jgi:LPS-assembly lipoprotein
MSSSSRVLRPSRAGAPALAGVLAALAAVLLLGACGFQLRGEFKYPFSTIYINAPEGNPINTALRRAIDGAGGARVVDSAAAAEVILDVPAPVEDKSVLSLSGGGRVREFALSTRVSFRLHDASGREWLPTSQIVLYRSFTFVESEVLAREYQEVRLLREMQGEAVQQIARRLQGAKPPS